MNEDWGRDTELEKWMTVICVGGWGDGEFRLSHREIFLMLPGLLVSQQQSRERGRKVDTLTIL